jgi:hypothetical protein
MWLAASVSLFGALVTVAGIVAVRRWHGWALAGGVAVALVLRLAS